MKIENIEVFPCICGELPKLTVQKRDDGQPGDYYFLEPDHHPCGIYSEKSVADAIRIWNSEAAFCELLGYGANRSPVGLRA